MDNCDVAIIGAGPYGLSIAAHLKALKVNFRIFGSPMEFWQNHMPKGMHLKSEGFASSLYDPGSIFTLKHYCHEYGLPYADHGSPVPLEVFSSYGLEFQRRFVTQLEQEKVALLQHAPGGFQVTLRSGETFIARRVVIAVGFCYYEYLPPQLASLPKGYVSHSSMHSNLDHFKGREVVIVGGGASAIDLAALLRQAGAFVQVIARVPKLRFQDAPDNVRRSWLDRLRAPVTGIGHGWKLWVCANLPRIFRLMPEKLRVEKLREILQPEPCWFTREQVVGKVELNVGTIVDTAVVRKDRVILQLVNRTGVRRTITTDHVISATGYRPNLGRLDFIDADIISAIQCVDTSPALSSDFESTVRNLYFAGISAANTFGPLLQSTYGAGYAAPRIARHLARTASRVAAPFQSDARSHAVENDTATIAR